MPGRLPELSHLAFNLSDRPWFKLSEFTGEFSTLRFRQVCLLNESSKGNWRLCNWTESSWSPIRMSKSQSWNQFLEPGSPLDTLIFVGLICFSSIFRCFKDSLIFSTFDLFLVHTRLPIRIPFRFMMPLEIVAFRDDSLILHPISVALGHITHYYTPLLRWNDNSVIRWVIHHTSKT